MIRKLAQEGVFTILNRAELEEITDEDVIIELSKGRRLAQEGVFYGVSVFEYVGNGEFEVIDHELNQPFDTEKEARKYIGELKENKW